MNVEQQHTQLHIEHVHLCISATVTLWLCITVTLKVYLIVIGSNESVLNVRYFNSTL